MAAEAQWTDPAEAQLDSYLAYLATVRPSPIAEALKDLRDAADAVARRPGLARPSRWRGLLERSVLRWRKLLVLEPSASGLLVLALYDMRQDLSDVDPRTP